MPPSLTVKVPKSQTISYPIYISDNLLTKITQLLPQSLDSNSLVIITDSIVKKHYGIQLKKNLEQAHQRVFLFSFPAGEKNKIAKTKQKLEEQMLAKHCGRDTLIIALGGGVVGDLAGFIAATYMRGIPYVQVPTSLLAMLDSSVGGKTGFDNHYGKNLIGAFWQPQAVIADLTCIKTLSQQQRINGLIEAIKIFLSFDAPHFNYLEKNLEKILSGETRTLKKVVARAVALKAEVVAKDEREQHIRKVLNLGHTIGHALEQLSNYKLLHGYAVAYGILVETKIAELLGLVDKKLYRRIEALLTRLNIHAQELAAFDSQKIIAATQHDKKNVGGKKNYVLLKAIGKVHHIKQQFAHPVADDIVKAALRSIHDGGK